MLLCSATEMRLLMGLGYIKSCRSILPRSGNHSLSDMIVRGDVIALLCYRQTEPFARWVMYYSMQPHGGIWAHTSSLRATQKRLQPSRDKSSKITKKMAEKNKDQPTPSTNCQKKSLLTKITRSPMLQHK